MIEAIRSIPMPTVSKKGLSRNFRFLALISAAHLPLGLLIYFAGSLAILHPLAVFATGLYWAVNTRYRLERVALAVAYIIGTEVLWRMAQVPVFWEFGKYGSAVIVIVALLRRNHFTVPMLPLFYFLLLIPSCILTFLREDFRTSQALLSTHISGPFFLLVASWFFSHCKFDSQQLRKVLFSIVIPLLSVGVATLFFTVTMEDIQFNGESNFATSGGFGPNQVSAMLGLGAFVALASLLIFQNSIGYRVYLMVAAIFLSAQSVMTFSRGGIYNAIGAIIVVSIIAFKSPAVAARRLAPIAGLVILFFALVFPIMNNFTGGQLLERFEDTETTSRAEIAESDLQLFLENPFLGVGVGASYDLRTRFFEHKAMSHTEFSRLLSEHGIFGVAALLMLVFMIFTNFRRQRTTMGQAFVAGVTAWSCLFMLNAAMRLAAPSLMLGLMFATIISRGQVLQTAHKREVSPRR